MEVMIRGMMMVLATAERGEVSTYVAVAVVRLTPNINLTLKTVAVLKLYYFTMK